jgi:membrane-associated phospholipid phosphatase
MTARPRGCWYAFVILGTAMLAWTQVVILGGAAGLDERVHTALAPLWRESLHAPLQVLAVLGGAEVTFAVTISLGVHLFRRGFRADLWALLALPLASLLEALDKRLILHPGPPPLHADGPSLLSFLSAPGGPLVSSYPSGHMVRTVVVYGLLAFVVSRLAATRLAGRLAVSAAAVIIAAMSADRLYLAVHWASDVVGGLLLGGMVLAGSLIWLDRPWARG